MLAKGDNRHSLPENKKHLTVIEGRGDADADKRLA
jgi:hypothetical protein